MSLRQDRPEETRRRARLVITVAVRSRDELIAENRGRSQELRAGTHSWRARSTRAEGKGRVRKVVSLVYFWAICVGLLAAMVAVGTPRSDFITLFIVIGAVFVVYRVIEPLIWYGLPRLLRSRSDSDKDRIKTVVFGAYWVTLFVVTPTVANLFFGVDVPLPPGELLLFGVLIAVLSLVARLRSRGAERPEQDAKPRAGDGLFPGATLIARPIAWLLERSEAK